MTYNSNHPKRKKNAIKAQKKLRTIEGRVVRELVRKLPEEVLQNYYSELLLYQRVLNQKRGNKNKIYSLHKPFTACIAKGKAYKQYEMRSIRVHRLNIKLFCEQYGSKVGVMVNPEDLVILAVHSYEGNPHDNRTIESLLDQMKKKPELSNRRSDL